MELVKILIQTARQLGFELYGTVEAGVPPTFDAFERYVHNGMNAGMTYLAEQREARRHPNAILPGVQSLLMLGISWTAVTKSPHHPVKTLNGIAEYARGTDYHRFIRTLLQKLEETHREIVPHARCRGVVDTAPLLEKAWAAEAGLGFIGKNTLLIHPRWGSKFFLAALLSTEKMPRYSDQSLIFPSCDACTRCLDACPTGALSAPYLLDARKCLSYWTIEQKEMLPLEIAEKRENRFFGCDTCQDVCPMNQHVPKEPAGTVNPFLLSNDELQKTVAGSPVERVFR